MGVAVLTRYSAATPGALVDAVAKISSSSAGYSHKDEDHIGVAHEAMVQITEKRADQFGGHGGQQNRQDRGDQAVSANAIMPPWGTATWPRRRDSEKPARLGPLDLIPERKPP